ncbi:hypothetical protein ILYODFUR_020519, partial [Ilyodon furcidens]
MIEEISQDIIYTTNSNIELHNSLRHLSVPSDIDNHSYFTPQLPTNQSEMPNDSESSKRPRQALSHSTKSSPTQLSLPKRAALFSSNKTKSKESCRKTYQQFEVQFNAELSRSTPCLVDPPDKTKFWLELDSVHPENIPQSSESLQSKHNLQKHHVSSTHRKYEGSSCTAITNASLALCHLMSQDEISTQKERTHKRTHAPSDSDPSLPSPIREQPLSSDLEACGEESDPQLYCSRTAAWIMKRQGHK